MFIEPRSQRTLELRRSEMGLSEPPAVASGPILSCDSTLLKHKIHPLPQVVLTNIFPAT